VATRGKIFSLKFGGGGVN